MTLHYAENNNGKRRICWGTVLLFALVCCLPAAIPYFFYTYVLPEAEIARQASPYMGAFIGGSIFSFVLIHALRTPVANLPRRATT